ncbi:hypothetical protein [Marinilabilia sp.]|uniref:hypothetical protein n=1 Tax=Marinilabilia sp. TaxID=2021252 RepID=UPI0025C30DD9|nr:hypothetical protein [Marinilabilia sp.]
MSVNRFAAHFMLSPEGALVRWPVVAVSDEGVIESVECFEHGFKERPFTRFFSGILCPAFVDICSKVSAAEILGDQFLRNRHFRDGTLILGVKDVESTIPAVQKGIPVVVQIPTECQSGTFQNQLTGSGTILERMKGHTFSNVTLEEALFAATTGAAKLGGLKGVGRLEPGANPGLLLLRNVDLVNKQWTAGAAVKWLNVPDEELVRG